MSDHNELTWAKPDLSQDHDDPGYDDAFLTPAKVYSVHECVSLTRAGDPPGIERGALIPFQVLLSKQ